MLNEEKQLWNIRKLTELPYCLARCQRTGELKQLLTDYSWLKACVRTMPCADIINWFSDVIPVVPLGRYINEYSGTLYRCFKVLHNSFVFTIIAGVIRPVLTPKSSGC